MAIDFTEIGLELTEEQQTALTSAITKEVDRARTQASQSAHNNANMDWEKKLPDLISAAVAKQTAEANKTAEQKAQEQYQAQIDELQANYNALKAANTIAENKNKVRAAGITDDDAVNSIAAMFVQDPSSIDGFLTVYNDSVSAGVKAAQKAQMNGATPPGNNSNQNVGGHTAALTQDTISQMVKSNSDMNGGMLDESRLFADLRVAQTAN